MVTIIRRIYQILAPVAQRDALHVALDALVGLDKCNLTSAIGPEAEPDAGYAVTITHYIGGPDNYEADFQLVRAMILSDWPDCQIADQRWIVDDDGEIVMVSVDGAFDLKKSNGLADYDEVWAI